MTKRKDAEADVSSLLTNWDQFLSSPSPAKTRIAEGKKRREKLSRKLHGEWKLRERTTDALDLLREQDETRVDHLVPIRYGRMAVSPFTFFRGSAMIMANDLATMPRTDLQVQLCGDCHLSNFGIFATPERNVIFDLNDFDETLPGPLEWDLKRLAASFVIAAENNGFKTSIGEECVANLARSYRQKMEEFSQMNSLDVWYHRINWAYLVKQIKQPGRRKTAIASLSGLQEKRGHAAALAKLTVMVNGTRQIRDQPPLIYHTEEATRQVTKEVFHNYAESMWKSRRRLLQRYRLVDIAAKVVGVGSVRNAAGIVLLQGEGGDDDYIMLQIKEARPSVLERYIGSSEYDHPGERIVNGQRLLQAATDMFLGWTSGPKRMFYIRQLMDMKDSVAVEELDAVTLEQYAEVCGYALARGHARSGDPAAIHGYLGKSTTFDEALTKFAVRYKNQNERDYDTLVAAIKSGKVQAEKA